MFISDKFIFNGIYSDDMGVALVTFGDDRFRQYGLNYSQEVTSIKNGSDMSHFTEEFEDIEEIELNLMLIDRDDRALVWDDMTTSEIIDWFITDSFVEFISEDNTELVYFLKTTKIVKNFTTDKQGFLQITLQPFSNLAYLKQTETFTFKDEGNFVIDNLSTLKQYKPIIEIKNLEDKLNIITLENITTKDEIFEIRGLENNEIVTIDSQMGTVFNSYGDNKLMNCNRKWLKLKRGTNTVKVSKNVEITIKCLFPVRV